MISERRLLKRKYWFTEEEITAYQQFYDCSITEIKHRFLSHGAFTGLRPYLDELSWHPVIHNKWMTVNYYPQKGICMPETYGLLHKIYGSTVSGEKLCCGEDLDGLVRKKNLEQIAIKHIGGGVGNNVLIIDHINKSGEKFTYRTVAKEVLDHDAIDDFLNRTDGGLKGYLVEEKLDLHPQIQAITGGGLSSIRLETLQNGEDVNKVQFAFIRLGMPGRETDHLSRNGIYATVDVNTGIIKKGVDVTRPVHEQQVSNHPSSGRTFEGVSISGWAEIKELALKAAAVSPGLRRVGWDVVPTLNGPRLLEGNVGGSILIDQLLCGGYFENGVFDDWMEYLQIPKPDGSLSWRYMHWNKGRRLSKFEHLLSSVLPSTPVHLK
jgi:hypothetical protein